MIRNLFLFAGTFVAGALIALVARAALFSPHGDHAAAPHAGGDYAPMVTNTLTPAVTNAAPAPVSPTPAPPVVDHSQHGAAAPAAKPAGTQPVNTICAICGMDVDPKLPTAVYQGQTIGFGCRMCPPKFKADPDRYGPAYLRNEQIKR